MQEIKLTQYSRGSGCGCKIAPDVLEKILKTDMNILPDRKLLVGNHTKDDAAVYDLENGLALISTVDFFMPVVDDPFDFGRIASANAISDVYAMGGKPILATALLGWPIDKLPTALASRVLDGARSICEQAGITLAGGHSVDSVEPVFGLSVNGLTRCGHIKTNAGAKPGDLLYLTKKLGTGIFSTALKRGAIKPEHEKVLITQMTSLNKFGEICGSLEQVHAMTDITGFGFLGHLIEMMEAARCSANIDYSAVPVIDGLSDYTLKMIVPDNLYRNWNSYEKKVNNIGAESFFTLNDPQTNGGLLISVDEKFQHEFENLMCEHFGMTEIKPVGRVKESGDVVVNIL